MESENSGSWMAGFLGLFFVLAYFFVGPAVGFKAALLFHLGVSGFYLLTIASFGRNSCIEMGVVIGICAILTAVLVPEFSRLKLKKQQYEKKALERAQGQYARDKGLPVPTIIPDATLPAPIPTARF